MGATGQSRIRHDSRLWKLVWPFIAVVLLQGLLGVGSLYLISGVRAYVGGESLWSKGQKDAIHYLQRYGETRDADDYRRYQEAIAIPLGDRLLRTALDSPQPDYELARKGILAGGNHPDDVGAIITLYRYFHDFSYFNEAVRYWKEGDRYLDQLQAIAEEMHQRIQAGQVGPGDISYWDQRIQAINEGVTPASMAFSAALAQGSRSVMRLLLAANIVSGLALILLAAWRTRNLLLAQRAFQSALDSEREKAQTTLAAIGDAVITIDENAHIAYLNPAAERMIGWDSEMAVGLPLKSLLRMLDETSEEEDLALVGQVLRGEVEAGSEISKLLQRLDGSGVVVTLVGTPIRVGGRIVGAALVLHDMTRERQYMESLSWQATHDSLTGLSNRREFEYRLEQALERSAQRNDRHSLMYLDLDQFKLVNDTCGHAAGDELLRQACSVLESCLREGDTLARLGGDEFGVLLENCPPEVAEQIAENLRQGVENLHFVWDRRPFNITVSIGVVHVTAMLVSVEEALRCADMACYLAKEKGRNRAQVFSPDDSELSMRFGEMAWVQRIRQALDEDRFRLFAQRIRAVDPQAEEGLHVELLLRVLDENGRLVPPNDFIPAAERYGLMPLIDRWVANRAFEILAERREAGCEPIATCAINLSGATIGDASFIQMLRELQPAYGLAPENICFEVTETSAIANLVSATQFIHELKAMGYRFSLDDFCAGMSSFVYLKHLPVDYLKIDGSFIKDMLDDPIDRAMVQVINQIGHVMGKRTVAEFVESEEILEALREIGIDYAQGYAVGRPLPFNRHYSGQAEPALVEPDTTSGR
ncbi:EAL domain-containing protein [Pseudomonas citronellolis]|jgi:diguanylate cyclase (GGDEF)-like protein/PAS domain S-box-containing protein|uniref:EAL domain-containing protein n=1 Tax=Pseudomonas citronellolis TaxID=53408 RepID=A0AAW6PGR8_9PSED|nr:MULTISPECIES: EAL domain-containing protein [Pseudomonas]KWR85847.1 PAS domain S-box protein [Pseudomonas sp. PI1]MDF3845900.1 EAL domain-containing protein [Pseudomonas citronellolis]WAB92206.1 EAL domain-containing protein [Pseudomonas citronellolis]